MASSKPIVLLFFSIVLGILIKLFAFDFLTVSGDSMYPAIKDRETIFVLKCKYGFSAPFSPERFCTFSKPKTGDTVIFFFDNKQVVKRIYATEGESLEYSKKSVYNNDIEFFEYSLNVGGKTVPLSENQFERLSKVTSVPEGFVLCLGDNFPVSIDSRNYGFVSEKNILGKILGK